MVYVVLSRVTFCIFYVIFNYYASCSLISYSIFVYLLFNQIILILNRSHFIKNGLIYNLPGYYDEQKDSEFICLHLEVMEKI